MKLVLFGPPGAGKGTQAEILSAHFQIPTISTGAVLREAVKNGAPAGLLAKSHIDAGELVPDEVVTAIIKERLAEDDCKNGFILDGFPRTVSQAQALESFGAAVDAVLYIDVSDADIIERLKNRRVCDKCGSSFSQVKDHAEKGAKCPKCGGSLTVREDDAPEVVAKRLQTYHGQTEPVRDYYAAKGILKTVKGQTEIKATTRLTFSALGLE